jgi:hypothetical protein
MSAIDPMGLRGEDVDNRRALLNRLGKGEFSWSYTLWESKDKTRQMVLSFSGTRVTGCEDGWICADGEVELSYTKALSKKDRMMVLGVENFNDLAVTVTSTATYGVKKWIEETYTVDVVETVKDAGKGLLDSIGGGGSGSPFDGVELGGGGGAKTRTRTETRTRLVLNPEYDRKGWKKKLNLKRAKARQKIYGTLLTKMKKDPVTLGDMFKADKSVSVSGSVSGGIKKMRICACPKARSVVASVSQLSLAITAQAGQTKRRTKEVMAQAALVVETSGVWNVTKGSADIGCVGKITMSFDLPGKWQVTSKVIELWSESMKVNAPKLWDKPKNMPKCTGS